MKKTLIAIAAAGVLASGAAAAGTTVQVRDDFRSPGFVTVQNNDRSDDRAANISERESRINDRIQRGLRDGRITDREARQLYRELRDVRQKERSFNSDGRISGREHSELSSDLDRLADHVRQQMRDEQRR